MQLTDHSTHLFALALAGALIIPLSGCVAASAPASDTAAPTASPSPTADESVVRDLGPITDTSLTFDEGAALPSTGVAQWTDDLSDESDWTLTSPDEGKGTWGFTNADGTCTATYWQGQVYDMTADDDLAASDFVIAALAGTTPDALGDAVASSPIGLVFGEHRAADMRIAMLSGEGRSIALVVRGFAELTSALTLTISCDGDAAGTVAAHVVASSALQVVDWG